MDFEQAQEMDAAPEVIWLLVSDRRRLSEWVPTTTSSRPAGDDGVDLRGESHGHGYDSRGGFIADDAAHTLSWDSPRYVGYKGALIVTEHGTGSRVTVRVTIPQAPPEAHAELELGLNETLDRIAELTRT